MTTINLALNIQVVGGPQIAISKSKSIEAYDKVEVSIDNGASDKKVDIQPGDVGQLTLILIKSNAYHDNQNSGTFTLSYKVSDGNTDSSSINLDEPQIYIGSGAISLFSKDKDATPIAPKLLKFTCSSTDPNKKNAPIEILVGRDATP